MALIPPFFLDCVVALGSLDEGEEQTSWIGSGFLWGDYLGHQDGQRQFRVFLVTNKHVLKGVRNLQLRFNPESGEPARQFTISMPEVKSAAGHPDPKVDVAAISISGPALREEGIRFAWFDSARHCMTVDEAKEAGVSEGDAVYVLGFPMGYVGSRRNYVIVRQGCLARVRDVLEGDSPDFLVDAAVFPGNSGGPVVARPELTSITGTKNPTRAALLGIVTGYFPYEDTAISVQTRRPRVVFVENSGLAIVVPTDRIKETVSEIYRMEGGRPAVQAKVVEVDASLGEPQPASALLERENERDNPAG